MVDNFGVRTWIDFAIKKMFHFFKDRKIGFPKHSNYVVENYVDFFALKVGWLKLKQIGWTCVRCFLWLKYSMIQS